MFNRQSLHVAMLLWGCIFCLIAALCMFMSRNFDKGKRKWVIYMQLTCAALLGNDALAWIYRGSVGRTGYYMVRISNFLVFALTDMMLFMFHGYVCYCLFKSSQSVVNKRNAKYPVGRIYGVHIIAAIGVFAVILSQFTDLYYYIDENNLYHRNGLYIISLLIPIAGILMDLWLIIQYRKNVSAQLYISLMSYIVLIAVAAGLLLVYYGISFVNIAICISMIFIFVISMIEQNQELAMKKKEASDLRISMMLSQIAPHFIYNSLTTIQGMCEKDPAMAKETVGEFAQYLRGNLESLSEENMIPFEKEFKHSEAYLAIEKKRFGDKINVNYDIGYIDFQIPPLSMQVLVENAVKHGIRKKAGGGTITIRTKLKDGNIYVIVKDDGVGFDAERIADDANIHVGIANVQNRLESMCGGRLEVDSKIGEGTTAVIILPRKNAAN